MPRHDPLPISPAADTGRLRYAIRLVAAFGLATAIVACLLVASGSSKLHPHMLAATAIGTFLTVFVGGSLVLLSYFSSASGHDQEVADFNKDDEQ